MKKNIYRILLIILIILIGIITSCSPKIILTSHDGSHTKTIKCKGNIIVDDEHVHFITKKGTKQAVPKDMCDFEIE